MNTCFFIGHRDTPADMYSQIASGVEKLALHGVTEFVVGHYGAFDRMAAKAVREAKWQHPEIRLALLLPYYETDTSKYGTGFDGIIYPEGQETIPKRAAIIRANQYMIDYAAIRGSLWIMRREGSSTLASRKSLTLRIGLTDTLIQFRRTCFGSDWAGWYVLAVSEVCIRPPSF